MHSETPGTEEKAALPAATPAPSRRRWLRGGWWLALVPMLFLGGFWLSAAGDTQPSNDLLTQLRQVQSSSLSDAMDELIGRRGYMNHDMRPVSKGRLAGRAKTVLYSPAVASPKATQLGGLYGVRAIDESGPGDVVVLVTGDPNITGLGGLMATTAKARGLEGVVVDGAVRDLDQIDEAGLTVYARSVSPSTSVGRYVNLAKDVPVVCAGVLVHPGDYIVGDRDGVVCIPAQHIDAVLRRAVEIEATEAKMFPMIRKEKSLEKVINLFKRI
jgi:regulator of RNase E activity RraA